MLNRKFLISVLFLTTIFGSFTYYAASRLTALMALRWFAKQTNIPLEIKSARWKTSWHELLRGQIEELEVDAKQTQSNLWIHFQSRNVHFKKNHGHWTVELSPLIGVNSFPSAKGTMTLELDGSTKSVSSVFHLTLTPKETIPFPQGFGFLKYETAALSGTLVFDLLKSALVGSISFRGEGLHYESSQSRAFEIQNIDLQATSLKIVKESAITIEGDAKLNAKNIQSLWDGHFLEKKEISGEFTGAKMKLEDSKLPYVSIEKINILKPYEMVAKILMQDGKTSGNLSTKLELQSAFEDVYKIFEEQLEVLKGLQLKGILHFKTQFANSTIDKANLAINMKHLLLPLRKVEANGIDLQMNTIAGHLRVRQAKLGPWQTKDMQFQIQNLPDALSLKSTGPISIPIWSHKIDVSQLKMTVQKMGSLFVEGALAGGPFPIEALQKDFCFMNHNKLPGFLKFSYPSIQYDGTTLTALGHVEGTVLNGSALLNDIKITTGSNPKIETTGALHNLDLAPLGVWLNFGEISGNLDIVARDAVLALTALGPVPLEYDFTIKGSDSENRKLHFSAEALDNLMDMMGVKDATSGNPIAAVALSAWRFIGNTFTFLNNLDYFGFRAKTQLGYTSLTTFDPPTSKNHYLIHGNSFKMPIKSSSGKDVYPVIMRTEEFQGWLWGRVAWFKTRSKEKENDKHNESSCTPVW